MTAEEQKTILLVASDSFQEQPLAGKLKKIGYDVITADTGDEAAAMVFAEKRVDFILMDFTVASELFETNRRLTNELAERKRAEEEHRLSEARFRSLFENSPNGIIISDPESLIIIDCNSNAAIMNGYEREELIGQSLNMLHTDEIAAAILNAVAQKRHLNMLLDGVVTAEGIHRRKDGSLFPIETSYSLITLGGKQLVMGIDRDISERKHAEEALHESEEIFRCFMDHSPIYVFFKDENIRSLRLSRNFEQMLGKPISELLGKTMDDLFPSDLAKAMIADDIKILHDDKEIVVEEELNGRYYTTTKFPLHIEGKPPYLAGFTIDITERKRAEDAMRTTKHLLEQTFEQSPIPMVLVSMPDAVIRIANPACIRFLGMDDEPSPVNIPLMQLKASWQDYSLEGALGTTEDLPLARSLMGVKTNAEERRIVLKDGTVRDELVYGCPIFGAEGIVVAGYLIMLDITERKQSERLLAQERERLSVTLRSIGDGVITTDTRGNIVMLNKAAEEMTGWNTADAAGLPLLEVFMILNELTREPCESPVEKVMSTGAIVELASHTCLISKNGREIVITDSGAPIRDNESRITGVVIVFRDMTEKQKLLDSMQREQKLESLGILAGGIAHDFNNLLAGIFGYLDMAQDNAAKNKTDQIPKYLNKALAVFERAKGLTQQLLTFSKGGTPVRKTIAVGPLIQHSATFALSGSNVTCQFDLAQDLWLCDCDENQIGQAIDNIVINGKQAMPMGGTIVITAVNVAAMPSRPGRYIRISIHDHGIGMPKEILPNIFDPFFSTKKTGHGLGLATVYSIVQRHDGWIDVESAPGKGSTFHIFIPASQKEEVAGSQSTTEKHVGTGTILVMDDEDFMLEIVGDMIQEMGYTVARAKNGEEAIALFSEAEKCAAPFVACILDLTIPGGIGGKEVAAAMRQMDPSAVIIASSGYSEHPIIANPTKHGFTDSIIKPYRNDDLTELMRRISKP